MKQTMMTLLMAALSLPLAAQKFVIDFHAPGAGGDLQKIELVNAETGQVIDSFQVSHERAHMEGRCEGLPRLARIKQPGARRAMASLVLDTTPTTVTFDQAKATSGTNAGVSVKGSAENALLDSVATLFNSHVTAIQKAYVSVRTSAEQNGGKPSHDALSAYQARMDREIGALRGEMQEVLKTDSQSRASLFILAEAADLLDHDFVRHYLRTYPHAGAACLSRLVSQLRAEELRAPGTSLIDFALPDESGTEHRLSEYVGHGHYVLVDFWASWCGPCRQEMPNVKAAYERFHPKGFDILSISFDNSRDAWLKGIRDLGMTWTHLSDLKGWNSEAAKQYQIHAIPCTILFGPDGTVVASDLRGEALATKLEELIQ